MTALRFDHAALPVADAAAARALFGDVLGLPLVAAYAGDDWDGAPWLMMIYGLAGGGQIALCALAGRRPARRPATDLPHHAFSVGDPALLARWRARLAQAGFAVRDEDHGGQQSIYFEDGDGATWEITCPPSRNDPDPDARATVDAWLAAHGKGRRRR
jgi:catechol 2,3-dioxygenase-like lactoylglutathione lyase family enzyme